MDEIRLDEFDDQSFEEDEPEVAIDADVIDRLAAYTQEARARASAGTRAGARGRPRARSQP